MNITLVPVANVDEIWPLISERVDACLEKAPGAISAGQYWTMCRSGEAFLIIAVDETGIHGVTIWKFAGQYFECLLLFDMPDRNGDDWYGETLQFALRLAKKNGCKGIGGNGRLGHVKRVKTQFPNMKIIRQTYIVEA